jgi:hypothetical protein
MLLKRSAVFAMAVLVLAGCDGAAPVATLAEPGPWETDTIDHVGVWTEPISYTLHAGTEWERRVRSAYIPTTELTLALPTGYEYGSARLLHCRAELKDFRGSGGSVRPRPASHGCSVTLELGVEHPSIRLLYPADTLGLTVYPAEGDDYPPARPWWAIETVRRTR